jgi:uncharacterized protein
MENIASLLTELETKKNIKILFACETGSRAWGFPSPDSDYDIRFIYMHERDWYLSLNNKKDTIEYMNGDLDITGWDLKKCLLLLKKSNAPLIERFMSPIEYYTHNSFKDNFRTLIDLHYSPTAVFYHHYSLAAKFWESIILDTELKLKSFFYLTRSLLCCNWVIKNKSVLPMHMEGLMELTGSEHREQLRELIKLKATVGEKYLHPKDNALTEPIRQLWQFVNNNKENLGVTDGNFSLLNNFFLTTVNGYANTGTS